MKEIFYCKLKVIQYPNSKVTAGENMGAFLYFTRILIAAVAINVALCESDICSTDIQDECKVQDKLPQDYPKTAEDLKEGCDALQELVSCYLNYFDTCKEHRLNSVEFRRFAKFIQENCHENSDAFKAISSNLDCFTSTMESLDKECRIDLFEETDFEDLMKQAGITYDDLESLHCIFAISPIVCKSRLMEKRCGSELGEVLSNILQNTDYRYIHHCSAEVLAGLSLFEEALEVAVSERKWDD